MLEDVLDTAAGNQYQPFLTVRWDHELERIQRLPRRPGDIAVPEWETAFLREGSSARLRPIQARALHDLVACGGLLGPIGVGWGKELISLLAPTALGAKRPLLLVPAQLRLQVIDIDHPRWSKEFWIYPLGNADWHLTVVSYEHLSVVSGADVLERMRPDLIIANEAHKLARSDSARTKRFLRYFRRVNPGCRFVALSGTMTTKSLRDYAHLAELALRNGSPLPSPTRAWSSLKEWSEALDPPRPGELVRSPGALVELADEKGEINQEQARAIFRKRLVETPGVVATEEGALGCSLILQALAPEISPVLRRALADLRRHWVVGEDEEIEDGARLWAFARQLALGFYYRWDWQGAKDREWLDARAAWHREVRAFLSSHSRPGMDSPALLAAAAQAGRFPSEAWPAWDAVRDRPAPPLVAEWLDQDFLVEVVSSWLGDDPEPALVWYEQRAVGEHLAKRLGLPLCAEGEIGARTLFDCASAKKSAIASIKAHREGKNLATYARALVTCPPSSGAVFEQLIGRLHRPGQEADEVTVDVLAHTEETREALRQALADATYLQTTTGQVQKLCYASLVGWPERRTT